MYRIYHNEIQMIRFLKNKIYNSLPEELWDRYLFMYNKLLNLMDYPFIIPGKRVDNLEFYIDEHNSVIDGLICKEVFQNKVNFYIIFTEDYKPSAEFLIKEIKNINQSVNVYCLSKEFKEYLIEELQGDLINSIIKLYRNAVPLNVNSECCNQIGQADLYKHKEISYLKYPSNFLTFYGYMDEEKYIAICGIAPINVNRGEIISVNVLDPGLKRRGYGKKICEFGMNDMLELFKVYTWTANEENQGSVALATSLGFNEYSRIYCVQVK